MREILFICTGNYYRSRFAEAVFNHRARNSGGKWAAFSRGLAIHVVDGDISLHTELALQERGIDRALTGITRTSLTGADLARAYRVIALKQDEHRPMMQRQFPAWADQITYWAVHDIDAAQPAEALAEIEANIIALLDELNREPASPACMIFSRGTLAPH